MGRGDTQPRAATHLWRSGGLRGALGWCQGLKVGHLARAEKWAFWAAECPHLRESGQPCLVAFMEAADAWRQLATLAGVQGVQLVTEIDVDDDGNRSLRQ